MTAFPESGLAFLRDLEANNEKEWFHANKKRYERELKEPARAVVRAVNEGLQHIAPEFALEKPEKALNRINRDIRFSKDKTPYNTHVWAGFHDSNSPQGARAGLYFGFSNESFGVGGGAWKPEKEAMERLRAAFGERHRQFRAIIDEPSFKDTFGEVSGEAYKRVPKPWSADHPAAELLKLKGVHVRSEGPVEVITSEAFTDTILARMEQLLPFIRFLQAGMRA